MTDLLFRDGIVHARFDQPATNAILIRNGRVAALGEAAVTQGADAEVVSLDGATIVPGFIDSHVHPVGAGLTMLGCDLEESESAEEAVRRVAEFAAAHPDVEWITGGGWSMEWFAGGTPARGLLDAVVADRPVFLMNSDGHGAWVNSAALERSGVRADTPDPAHGRVEREPDGTPQGTLHESAMDLVSSLIPAPSDDVKRAALLAAQAHLHELGVTGWQDALVGSYATIPDTLSTYLDAARSGDLTGRVVGALWWDRNRGLEQIDDLVARREAAGGADGVGRFRATTVKMMLDGVAENQTAALLSPYLDGCGCQTGNSGLTYVAPELLTEAAVRLDGLGFQIHFHALGDRAVRQALDAVETCRAANSAGGRHHLAHLQVVHPDDVPRFAEVGATANIQALWACHEKQMDELTVPFLGDERAGWQYPFGALDAAGAQLCAGSDWPVSSADPLAAAYVAVTRLSPRPTTASDAVPLSPEQALSPATFLSAYTAGSARINGLEDEVGTLEIGKTADLVVLDGDPLDAGEQRICDIAATATYVGGELVSGKI